MDKLPPAMELLKDWSIWMVGLETGILGLVTFIGGKESFFHDKWARFAIFSFAGSIFFATWVLAALPDILLRMHSATDNFYRMPIFNWLPIQLWMVSSVQHWLFVFGVLFFMLSITGKLKT